MYMKSKTKIIHPLYCSYMYSCTLSNLKQKLLTYSVFHTYIFVHHNLFITWFIITVLYITRFKDGSQKCSFQYNVYIFVWL